MLKPVDETSLTFISIGSNCRITAGVKILGHDYSYSVLRPIYHCMYRKTNYTTIGDNVFIGINSIILMNTSIGDNVIIGAGSVVTGKIPSNVVAARNPAKVICTLEEFYKKEKCKFPEYAKTWFKHLNTTNGCEPTEEEMGWFVALWKSDKKENILSKLKVDGDSKEYVIKDVLEYESMFEDFNAFKKWAKMEE
jgi:Acetyltransferase (isoleucine patch superfamily)